MLSGPIVGIGAGQQGPQGPQGLEGLQGVRVSGYERIVTTITNASLAAGVETVRFANCPTGRSVLGGGVVVYSAVGRWVTGPTSALQWAVGLWNSSSGIITAARIEVWVICATVR